jgi:hypothetical protein
MPTRFLLIVDQLPFRHGLGLSHHASGFGLRRVRLGYVPRTTPTGHATIGTGLKPADHRVQGRQWYEDRASGWLKHDIDDLPAGRTSAAIGDIFFTHTICEKVRAERPDAAIVVAAAKAFIPFLFGCWHADLAVFPTTVAPQRVGSKKYLEVNVLAGTDAGQRCLVANAPGIESYVKSTLGAMLAGSSVACTGVAKPFLWSGLTAAPTTYSSTFEWMLPAGVRFNKLLAALAVQVDLWYHDFARFLLNLLGPKSERVLLQSWFSTDYYGHHFGANTSYHASARQALLVATARQGAGAKVVVTSDHGGRDVTRRCDVDLAANSVSRYGGIGPPVALPAVTKGTDPIVSGDHVVGYGGGDTAFYLEHSKRVKLNVPGAMARRSFHPRQMPKWLLLPEHDEHYRCNLTGAPSGGDHGACSSSARTHISRVDNEVPLFWSGGTGPRPPRFLHEVADWFVSM